MDQEEVSALNKRLVEKKWFIREEKLLAEPRTPDPVVFTPAPTPTPTPSSAPIVTHVEKKMHSTIFRLEKKKCIVRFLVEEAPRWFWFLPAKTILTRNPSIFVNESCGEGKTPLQVLPEPIWRQNLS